MKTNNGKLLFSKTYYGQVKIVGDYKYDIRYIPFEGGFNKFRISKVIGKILPGRKFRFDKCNDGQTIRLEIITKRKGAK